MNLKIVNSITNLIDNNVPDKYLSILQEFLLSGAIFTDASKFLAIMILFIAFSEILLDIIITLFNLSNTVLILPMFCVPGLIIYVIYQQERRAAEIERTAPDFLRQLSTMLHGGLNFENAM